MSSREDRARYNQARAELSEWIEEYVLDALQEFASGEEAAATFGAGVTPLDGLCLIAAWERAIPIAISFQIRSALNEGYKWSQVAAALGTSHQAAKKRFGGA